MDDEFMELVEKIIKIWKQHHSIPEDDPLDGDDTEKISGIVLIYADYHQGNITEKEFHTKLDAAGL